MYCQALENEWKDLGFYKKDLETSSGNGVHSEGEDSLICGQTTARNYS